MRPELDARGVRIVAVSPEKPHQLKEGHSKHNLGALMLADADLEVIDAFGLRNKGVHTGPPSVKGLPVPTSLLINAQGEVVWMDQSVNYQDRSAPDTVLTALQNHLP